jgi:hypothetical protein
MKNVERTSLHSAGGAEQKSRREFIHCCGQMDVNSINNDDSCIALVNLVIYNIHDCHLFYISYVLRVRTRRTRDPKLLSQSDQSAESRPMRACPRSSRCTI